MALAQNATILKAKNDLEASHGVVVQTRAVALPQVTGERQIQRRGNHAVELSRHRPVSRCRIKTGTRASRSSNPFTKAASCAPRSRPPAPPSSRPCAIIDTVVADTLLNVRLAYYDVLLAAQQIVVHEASVNLLQKELDDQQHRFDAGTVPQFQRAARRSGGGQRASEPDPRAQPAIASPKTTWRTCSVTICRATCGKICR